MKTICSFMLALVLAFITTALPIKEAKASVPIGTAVKVTYSSTNVGTSTWVPLVYTTARAIQGIWLYNSSAAAMKLGIAPASAAANSESFQFLIPAATSSSFIPVQFSQGNRISILSSSGTISSGELDISFLYY